MIPKNNVAAKVNDFCFITRPNRKWPFSGPYTRCLRTTEFRNVLTRMELVRGIEPRTCALRMRCSTS